MNKITLKFLRLIIIILITHINITTVFMYSSAGEKTHEIQDIEDLSLQDLLNAPVETASKKVEKSSDAPGIIEVISAQEIRAFGAVSLFDILQRASSIQTLNSHILIQNIINIRGDYLSNPNNHVLLLIDGRPIRELQIGGCDMPVLTAFPVNVIERIEIIRGPGSVLFGTNAFAGVINIITKREFQEPALMLSLGGGSFGGITGALTAASTRGNLKAILGTHFFKEEGWNYRAITAIPSFPDAPVDMKYGEKKIGVYSNLSYKNFQLSAFYANFYSDRLGTIPYASQIGNANGNRLFLDLGYSGNISENWSANLNFTLNLTDFSSEYTNPIYPPENNSSWGYLGESFVSGKISDNLNIVVGGVINIRKNISDEYSVIKKKYSQTHLSAYTQLDYRFLKWFKLIAGAQLNKPHGGDIDIVPRLGMVLNFEKGIDIKALYGQAFRSAWPIEQLTEHPGAVGNPDLGPEKIGTLDLQISYQSKNSRFSLTYFRNHIWGIMTRVPADIPGKITIVNKDKLDIQGIEFEMKASPIKNLLITGSASYQDNKDDKTFSPHAMFKLGTSYQTPFGLNIGLFLTHFGKSLKNQGLELNPEAKAINLLSLNLGFKPARKVPIEINLYIQNLLDEDYYFTEFSRGWVNTLPMSSGRAIYSRLIIRF